MKHSKLNRIALGVAMSVGLCAGAVAQETTSGIRGSVANPDGTPAVGATVTITHTESGTKRTVTTNGLGGFQARNLRVGGPYTVTVDSDQYQDSSVTDVFLSLGEPYVLNLSLEADAVESIVVTASRLSAMAFSERGPSANFSLEQLENAPAINRNLSDIVRIDSRIFVDESRGDINAIQCAGKNPRFNSLTVDGVRMNDSFGLNSNGYPTERMPFSFDAIEQVAVELAPFDVQYGGFTACNINAVTKSGTNEIHGSVFYDYTSDSLKGDRLQGQDIQLGDFTEKRYGFNIGGAIIEDELFFFAAYEELEGANLFDRGPIGSGAAEEVDVTQAELNEIVQIANTLYQYDPGPVPSSLENFDEKLLIKLDWNINDSHRLAYTYNYNDGNNFTESDGDLNEFEFENHLYERGAELNSHVLALYSDWTDNFSTEFRVSYLDLDNRQISVGGTDFGEIRIELEDREGLGDVDVYIGGDDSRQANKLQYDVTSFAFKGTYYMDNDHTLSFGIERESLDVFNMFVQHAETEIRFSGIENFRLGLPSRVEYENAPTHDPTDAAAQWSYSLNTIYAQDEFEPIDDLLMFVGFRYDWYTSDDTPRENPDFVRDYGFSNSQNLDGEGLFQPRLGFTYTVSDATTVRGGVGLYSGGNPNVWLSNSYTNDHVSKLGVRGRSFGYTDGTRSLFDDDVVYVGLEDGVPNGPGYGIPSELFDAINTGRPAFDMDYLDPDFKLPSEWKFALGATHILESEHVINADILVSRTQDAAIVLHGDLDQIGTDANGYPIYEQARKSTFVLTNTDVSSTSVTASIAISKSYDWGLDWSLGYAYSDAEDVQPMNSAVSFTNYQSRAFFDPQEQISSRSTYNIQDRFTATLNYTTAFFGDYETRFSLFASANSGQPYSVTFNGTIDPYNFTPYLDFNDNVLRPGTERNSEEGSWWTKADLKITQELPGFMEGHRSEAFLVIDNLTNLISSSWGVLEQVNFPNTVSEDAERAESRRGDASLYEIRLGFKYDF